MVKAMTKYAKVSKKRPISGFYLVLITWYVLHVCWFTHHAISNL